MISEREAKRLRAITTHGAYVGGREKPEHYIWRTMVDRCSRPTASGYKYYGAKGVTVCKRWLRYENFLADMGNRPSCGHSLDRVDLNKGYTPSNCRWATRSEQQKNKTTTKFYTDGLFVGTLVECAKHLGISKELAFDRHKRWGSFEKGKPWRILQRKK